MQGHLESKDVRLTVSIYPEVPKFEPQVFPKETAQGRYIFGGFGECSWKIFRGLALTTSTSSLLNPVSPAITPAQPEDLDTPQPSAAPQVSLAVPASQVTSQTIPSPQITPQTISQPPVLSPKITSSVQTI
jgi:hypothetical protein